MLIRVLLAAIFAGALAGIFATAVQSWKVIPLIQQAESYENAGVEMPHNQDTEQIGSNGNDDAAASDKNGHDHGTHDHSAQDSGAQNSGTQSAVTHDHGSHDHGSGWAPQEGAERLLYTALSNVIVGIAFALMLTAAVLVSGQTLSLNSGLIWGACGFAVFVLAPNFGLPPELPGMASGDLQSRQLWWVATALLTASGLGLFAFKRGWGWMALGVAFVLAPHLYGAPSVSDATSSVPANLAAEFAIATIVSSALFWLFLGGALGYLINRFAAKEMYS